MRLIARDILMKLDYESETTMDIRNIRKIVISQLDSDGTTTIRCYFKTEPEEERYTVDIVSKNATINIQGE